MIKSFSSCIKEELSQINNLNKKDLVMAELLGYFSTIDKNKPECQKRFSYSTQNVHSINRFSKLLTNIGENDFSINLKGKIYTIVTKRNIVLNFEIQTEEQTKSFVRGAFLGSGTLTNPKNNYHLEVLFPDESNQINFVNILNSHDILAKTLVRGNKHIVYVEEGESISKMLAFMEANKAVLEFEELRVLKDVKNNVNRKVNCETANINKVANSSAKQLADIKFLKSENAFKSLSAKDKEIANLRLNNPEASLAEIAELTNPKITKSGVFHRMSIIQKKADELRK